MKTNNIRACIEYTRHMESVGIGALDPLKRDAAGALAELEAIETALDVKDEALRKIIDIEEDRSPGASTKVENVASQALSLQTKAALAE